MLLLLLLLMLEWNLWNITRSSVVKLALGKGFYPTLISVPILVLLYFVLVVNVGWAKHRGGSLLLLLTTKSGVHEQDYGRWCGGEDVQIVGTCCLRTKAS